MNRNIVLLAGMRLDGCKLGPTSKDKTFLTVCHVYTTTISEIKKGGRVYGASFFIDTAKILYLYETDTGIR